MALAVAIVVQPGVVPSESPVVDPGTAVHTTIDRPGETAYVRVRVADGEVLPVTVAVPDLEPERPLAADVVQVRLIGPDGAEDHTAPVVEGPVVDGMRLVGEGEVRADEGGTWTVEVSASAPARVRVLLGEVDTAGLDAPGLDEWYATEPGTSTEVGPSTSLARPTDQPERLPGLAGTQAGGVPLMVVLTLPIVVVSLIALRPWRRWRGRRQPGT